MTVLWLSASCRDDPRIDGYERSEVSVRIETCGYWRAYRRISSITDQVSNTWTDLLLD